MKFSKLLFFFTEAALFLIFTVADLGLAAFPSALIKYISIIICFLFVIFEAVRKVIKGRLGGTPFILAAMSLTLAADWFLLVENDRYELGVFLFCTVQTVYFLKLSLGKKKGTFLLSSALRIFLFSVASVILLHLEAPLLYFLSAFSIINLLLNTALAAFAAFFKKEPIELALGLFLFLLCDICVGAFNLGLFPKIETFIFFGMWTFYLPSQALIAVSVTREEASL